MSTYTQIYIHVVFGVKSRASLIKTDWENELYKYITGVIQNKGNKMIIINGTSDHIHFLVGLNPDCSISDLVREVKKSSNEFINKKHFTKLKFYWQEGFGSFSYGHSQIDKVIKYILLQKEHHKKISFREEYLEFLNKYNIVYNDKYILNDNAM